MAKLVVLRFSDDETGTQFAQSHKNMTLGLYELPLGHCECPEGKRGNLNNWGKGKRSGIWLCRKCKKPSKFWKEGLGQRLQIALGKNLLEG